MRFWIIIVGRSGPTISLLEISISPAPIFIVPEYLPNSTLTERLETGLLKNRARFGDVLFRHYKLFHFEMGQMEL